MKILVVDDHALFREGICHVLNQMGNDITILEVSDCDQAIQHVSANPDIDLVLLDLNMPGKNGFVALELLTQRYPALPIVILSASNLRNDIQRALDKGAVGFIHKDTSSVIVINALRMILSGGIYVPPNMAMQQDTGRSFLDLTQRQYEVLAELVEGHSNKVIAAYLNLAEATVKMHVTAIFKRLGVSNRTQAALEAKKLGVYMPKVDRT
jgi:DNA-binding NarL/FixJ family response regulator